MCKNHPCPVAAGISAHSALITTHQCVLLSKFGKVGVVVVSLGPNWVKGGCRRQVDGTAGLPSAPEMPCASRQARLVPIPDLMLEVQLVDRGMANSVRGTGAGAFRDQRPGSGIACSQDRRPPSCSTASRITAKSIASRSKLTSGAD
jgi:hypothetical protein